MASSDFTQLLSALAASGAVISSSIALFVHFRSAYRAANRERLNALPAVNELQAQTAGISLSLQKADPRSALAELETLNLLSSVHRLMWMSKHPKKWSELSDYYQGKLDLLDKAYSYCGPISEVAKQILFRVLELDPNSDSFEKIRSSLQIATLKLMDLQKDLESKNVDEVLSSHKWTVFHRTWRIQHVLNNGA